MDQVEEDQAITGSDIAKIRPDPGDRVRGEAVIYLWEVNQVDQAVSNFVQYSG